MEHAVEIRHLLEGELERLGLSRLVGHGK
jgi:hypothetical protein